MQGGIRVDKSLVTFYMTDQERLMLVKKVYSFFSLQKLFLILFIWYVHSEKKSRSFINSSGGAYVLSFAIFMLLAILMIVHFM